MTNLVGYSRFKSKAGKDLCVASCVCSLTDRDISLGKVGGKVKEYFVPAEQYDYLVPSDVGKEVHIDYEDGFIIGFNVLRK